MSISVADSLKKFIVRVRLWSTCSNE